MKEIDMIEGAYKIGKNFTSKFDAQVRNDRRGRWYGLVHIGENYYETDPYLTREGAMSELKGYLEGLTVQMQAFMEYLDGELKNENTV